MIGSCACAYTCIIFGVQFDNGRRSTVPLQQPSLALIVKMDLNSDESGRRHFVIPRTALSTSFRSTIFDFATLRATLAYPNRFFYDIPAPEHYTTNPGWYRLPRVVLVRQPLAKRG
jgi:hypothetical protein